VDFFPHLILLSEEEQYHAVEDVAAGTRALAAVRLLPIWPMWPNWRCSFSYAILEPWDKCHLVFRTLSKCQIDRVRAIVEVETIRTTCSMAFIDKDTLTLYQQVDMLVSMEPRAHRKPIDMWRRCKLISIETVPGDQSAARAG
jgi:hypothetical protein